MISSLRPPLCTIEPSTSVQFVCLRQRKLRVTVPCSGEYFHKAMLFALNQSYVGQCLQIMTPKLSVASTRVSRRSISELEASRTAADAQATKQTQLEKKLEAALLDKKRLQELDSGMYEHSMFFRRCYHQGGFVALDLYYL